MQGTEVSTGRPGVSTGVSTGRPGVSIGVSTGHPGVSTGVSSYGVSSVATHWMKPAMPLWKDWDTHSLLSLPPKEHDLSSLSSFQSPSCCSAEGYLASSDLLHVYLAVTGTHFRFVLISCHWHHYCHTIIAIVSSSVPLS